uniref:Uncharacterized protein U1 n=1 Tax=Hyposoter didymator TaxID=260305 RepID=D7P5L8_HYPDD|nr:unknown [Hyposoter didymator]
MSRYLITDEDFDLMNQVAVIQVQNEIVDSKWEYEKKANRQDFFKLSSKPWSSNIKDRLKKSARDMIPTEIKSLRLTKEGCKHYACPSIVYIKHLGEIDINKVDVASLVKDDMPDVSEYCFQKYRRRLIERDNPRMKSPFDHIGNLQWRKMSDGHMGCSQDNEIFRNWALYPWTRAKTFKDGVTNAPPLVLHDDNQFDMTEKYCRFKGVSYKKADEGKHNDDCYVSRGQAVAETILGYWPRDLYR